MTINDATAQVRKVWDDQAERWYRERESLLADSRPVHEWLVSHIEPKPGQQLLELAAGPGDTGFLAAPLLGDGRVVSTDIAPAMVDAARKRARELGITNVEHRVIDAQAMDFEDASFDGVLCRWGFMLMPEPASALQEVRRVLKPHGRLSFAVFTGPDENPWVSIPVRLLRERGHLPQPGEQWQPGILALANPERLKTLVAGAGLTLVALERVDMTWRFANVDAYWAFLVELTALGPIFRGMDAAESAIVRSSVEERITSYTSANGVALPGQCWGVLAQLDNATVS